MPTHLWMIRKYFSTTKKLSIAVGFVLELSICGEDIDVLEQVFINHILDPDRVDELVVFSRE